MSCFVYRLTDRHATGLCGDVLFDVGLIGYGLASQLLCKVVQTNYVYRNNTQHKIILTTKPNETKLALVQVVFYVIRPGNRL